MIFNKVLSNMKASITSMNNDFIFNKIYLDKINSTLEQLVNEEFNIFHNCVNNDKNTLVDIITQLLIGSKKVRFGNYPSDYCCNSIKNLIQQKIANNKPIPILVPMGPHKTIVDENIDLAEIYALKTLSALNSRVCEFYPNGLRFYLRGEDITGWFLTGASPEIKSNIENYLTNLEKLIHILKYDKFIIPFRESQLIKYADVTTLIDIYFKPMQAYINDTDNGLDNCQELTSYKILKALGWKGDIPLEQRAFYKERYRRNYPNKSDLEINEMMINYLAISFAKSQLGALVPLSIKNNFIQLTFAPPVPGIPLDIASRRLYYRTLPSNISRLHLPFWRAKGFLSLENESVRLSINNWSNHDKFHRHAIKLSSNNNSVILVADIANNSLN